MTDLEAASEQILLNFLGTNLALCYTFAKLIKTELILGDVEAARSALDKAEAGYANIARYLPDVENADRNEIERQLVSWTSRQTGRRTESLGRKPWPVISSSCNRT